MLLTSTGAISRSQHQEESALLLRKIEELNKNTARLIAEAVKNRNSYRYGSILSMIRNRSRRPGRDTNELG